MSISSFEEHQLRQQRQERMSYAPLYKDSIQYKDSEKCMDKLNDH